MKCATQVLVVVVGLCLLLPCLTLSASAQSTASPEQRLADQYVPVAYLREQERECAVPPGGGEPYLPLPVEKLLDNPRILIRDGANGDEVVASGPSAADLAGYGHDTYMDFPGDPRRPGCTYETDERVRIAELGLEPTVYARIVFDRAEQRLALQYWFYWYFNDWNNTHESDWEMIQVMWDDISGVEAALSVEPDRVGYAQHGNGELATWGDDKLQLEDGTHPLVYPAAGSHATFFSNDTFLAWGELNSGFGCDVSSGPSVRTELRPVLVPDQIDPNSEFAWLLYEGRWGERQPGSFNGPLGAGVSTRWNDPWVATDNWRQFSIVVPEPNLALGPTMTDTFCTLVGAGSQVLIYSFVFPWAVIPALVIVVLIFAFFIRRSGDLLRRALRHYRQHLRVFIGIGLLAVPIGIAFNLAQAFLINRDPLRFLVQWFDNTAGASLSAVTAVGSIQQIAMLLLIAPAVIQAVADIQRGQTPGVVRSYRLAATRAVPIGVAALFMLVFAGVPLLTIIGVPISIWLLVRWQFFAQVLVFETERTSRESLHESARLVRRRWWQTLFAVVIFDLIATVPGIIVGFGLLTLGRTAVGFANGVSSLLYSLLIPLSVIGVTLMYLDRRAVPVHVPPAVLQPEPGP